MYTYIHAYIHTCTHTYMHTYTHAHILTFLPTYLRTYMYTHIHIHTRKQTHAHTYQYMMCEGALSQLPNGSRESGGEVWRDGGWGWRWGEDGSVKIDSIEDMDRQGTDSHRAVAVCCSVLQCVAVCCSVLQCVAVCCSVLQCGAVWCSVVQCGVVCCSVVQCELTFEKFLKCNFSNLRNYSNLEKQKSSSELIFKNFSNFWETFQIFLRRFSNVSLQLELLKNKTVELTFWEILTAAGATRVVDVPVLGVLQCVAVCCSVLQCVAVCCSVLQCVAVWCSVVQCVAVCCSVLQCVAVCCSVLQCVAARVAVCCGFFHSREALRMYVRVVTHSSCIEVY